MKVILATGIYAPGIGGPATYTQELAAQLHAEGIEVIVITYGIHERENSPWTVVGVAKSGGPFIRWWRYAKVLKEHGANADIVYALSTVSVGLPLSLAGLKNPKKLLRLGGDFFWERALERGAQVSLVQWYKQQSIGVKIATSIMNWLFAHFDHLVFSTEFQKNIYESHSVLLPKNSVIENALPSAHPTLHAPNSPLRLLYIGRFTAVKNLDALLQAVAKVPAVHVALVGSGPELTALHKRTAELDLGKRVLVSAPVHGDEKKQLFAMHDAFVLPSFSEVSPNAALEARAHGLPVLLTDQTGLSTDMKQGMLEHPMGTVEDIATGLGKLLEQYGTLASACAQPPLERNWSHLAKDHVHLFHSLLS